MSVRSNHIAHHATSTMGFPGVGGTPGQNKGVKEAPKKRVSAEERAEKARLDEGVRGDRDARRSEGPGARTRVVRKRVRRRRVATTQTQSNYGTSKADQAKQAKQAKTQAKAQNAGQARGESSNAHMMRRMNSQSNLNQMTANFRSNQSAGQPQGPQTPVGKKMAMLGNLQNYMKNDYAAMKANDQDSAFTYRTSEARQLVATLGTMVASSSKQTQKKETDTKSDSRSLTPAAFSRQKGLLRELKAMSDPQAPLPEGLPPDYKPFESVA